MDALQDKRRIHLFHCWVMWWLIQYCMMGVLRAVEAEMIHWRKKKRRTEMMHWRGERMGDKVRAGMAHSWWMTIVDEVKVGMNH